MEEVTAFLRDQADHTRQHIPIITELAPGWAYRATTKTCHNYFDHHQSGSNIIQYGTGWCWCPSWGMAALLSSPAYYNHLKQYWDTDKFPLPNPRQYPFITGESPYQVMRHANYCMEIMKKPVHQYWQDVSDNAKKVVKDYLLEKATHKLDCPITSLLIHLGMYP